MVEGRSELGPIGIIDPPCQDIDPMPRRRHRLRDFFHIDQLPAEIRMLGEMGIRRVEIALRIEKNNVHGVASNGRVQLAAAAL